MAAEHVVQLQKIVEHWKYHEHRNSRTSDDDALDLGALPVCFSCSFLISVPKMGVLLLVLKNKCRTNYPPINLCAECAPHNAHVHWASDQCCRESFDIPGLEQPTQPEPPAPSQPVQTKVSKCVFRLYFFVRFYRIPGEGSAADKTSGDEWNS